MLAVFVASSLASVLPVVNAAQTSLGGTARSLTDVLRVPFNASRAAGLTSGETAEIINQLHAIPGVTVLSIYADPSFQPGGPPPPPPPPGVNGRRLEQHSRLAGNGQPSQYDSIVSCAGLRAFPALGQCAAGVEYVQADITNDLLTDNPLTITLPVVNRANPTARATTKGRYLGALLVKTSNDATLERARTLLTLFDTTVVADGGLSDWQMGNAEAEAFGEIAQIRNNDDTNAENVLLAIVGLTLLMAACSLAVTVGGGIVERKRPFTLLRLSGTPSATLYRVVVLESVLPLLTASFVSRGHRHRYRRAPRKRLAKAPRRARSGGAGRPVLRGDGRRPACRTAGGLFRPTPAKPGDAAQ